MFTSTTSNTTKEEEKIENKIIKEEKIENTLVSIDSILEHERQKNKKDNWIKLDKTAKLQRLHTFAESYGKQHSMPTKDIKMLKNFFKDCLDKNKLAKSKDIVYNKEEMKIISIPSLYFNQLNHNFTLKITDTKRVSTLKSLTPKRIPSEVNKKTTNNGEDNDNK
jgi:hypothetical protein